MSAADAFSPRLYRYVGDDEGLAHAAASGDGAALPARWRPTVAAPAGTYTYVVDATGDLYLADRHSEHVACARGGPVVLAAGEITIGRRDGGGLAVESVTNLSTGDCPEPECWPAVSAALRRAGLPAGAMPPAFDPAFVFRRCPACGQRNVVKEGWFVCGACGADLPAAWNFGP